MSVQGRFDQCYSIMVLFVKGIKGMILQHCLLLNSIFQWKQQYTMQKVLIVSLLFYIAVTQSLTATPIFASTPLVPNPASQSHPRQHRCSSTQKWDRTLKQCVPRCIDTVFCIASKVWSPVLCTCVCANGPTVCPPGYSWTDTSCACVSSQPV